MPRINITVKNGKVKIDFEGMEGDWHDKIVEAVEEKLKHYGISLKTDTVVYKPEYYNEPHKHVHRTEHELNY